MWTALGLIVTGYVLGRLTAPCKLTKLRTWVEKDPPYRTVRIFHDGWTVISIRGRGGWDEYHTESTHDENIDTLIKKWEKWR